MKKIILIAFLSIVSFCLFAQNCPTELVLTSYGENCGNSDGGVSIGTVTGGVAPFLYSFNGSAFSSMTYFPNLSAGTYSVTVKDANNCIYTTNIEVANTPGPTAFTVTSTNATCGACNGTVSIGATTGGTSPYQYYMYVYGDFWGFAPFTGLCAAAYTVIVKDANGCTFSTSVTVANTPEPTALAITSTNTTCGNSNGTVTIGAVTGGTPPYTYSFNGGAYGATKTFTGLSANTYSVSVKDSNNCIYLKNTTIAASAALVVDLIKTDVACFGSATGSIKATISAGAVSPPYDFVWSTGAWVMNSASTTNTISTLVAGSYTVSVNDNNGCFVSAGINITQPSALFVNATIINSTCGYNNGSILINTPTGGTPPYIYSFNSGLFSLTTNFTNLQIGTYPIIVKDANLCTFSTSVTVADIPGPTALAVTSTDSNCGASNGTVTIGVVTGGIALFSFSFNGSAFSSTKNYVNLFAGTYDVSVRDIDNCIFTTTVTVTDNSGPTAVALTSTNETCGNCNGTVTIGAVTGGDCWQYSFDGGSFEATKHFTGLCARSYSVIVKDCNLCIFSTSVTVANTPGPTALAVTPTNTTCGYSNGSVTIGAVTGGTPPYTYSFIGGSYTATLVYNGLAAGVYPISVKDANGCTFNTTVTITDQLGPTALPVSVTNATGGLNNGTLTIGANGGNPPYVWSVNGGTFYANTFYSGLGEGVYFVIVMDIDGCQFATTATILNQGGHVISGNIGYNNSNYNAISNATVHLMIGTNIVATTTTDFYGTFTFSNVDNGTYTITANTSIPWGGVTATDVLKIRRHIIGLELLTEPIRLSAADANNSGFITSTDVLKIQRRIAALETSFTRADWIFEKQTLGGNIITVNNANVSQNFYMLCTGDVNGSYNLVLWKKK